MILRQGCVAVLEGSLSLDMGEFGASFTVAIRRNSIVASSVVDINTLQFSDACSGAVRAVPPDRDMLSKLPHAVVQTTSLVALGTNQRLEA